MANLSVRLSFFSSRIQKNLSSDPITKLAKCARRRSCDGHRVIEELHHFLIHSTPSPDFDQGLAIRQGGFDCRQMRCQFGSKRGVGGVSEPHPDYLQSRAAARPVGKVPVLRPDDGLRLSRHGFDVVVRSCTVAEVVDVVGRIACCGKPSRQARRQLRVDQETQDQAARMTRCPLAAAPKARAARTSASLR